MFPKVLATGPPHSNLSCSLALSFLIAPHEGYLLGALPYLPSLEKPFRFKQLLRLLRKFLHAANLDAADLALFDLALYVWQEFV